MGWRKKERETNAEPAREIATPKRSSSGTTQIGASVTIEGRIQADEDIVVSGTIRGEIRGDKHVFISETGQVHGEIHCHSVVISGEVHGNVHARENITIEQTGRLRGDITTKVLTNQPGGFFEGYSHMIEDGQDGSNRAQGSKSGGRRGQKDKAHSQDAGPQTGTGSPEKGKTEKEGNKA